jgi:hypothetical protein
MDELGSVLRDVLRTLGVETAVARGLPTGKREGILSPSRTREPSDDPCRTPPPPP